MNPYQRRAKTLNPKPLHNLIKPQKSLDFLEGRALIGFCMGFVGFSGFDRQGHRWALQGFVWGVSGFIGFLYGLHRVLYGVWGVLLNPSLEP